MEQQHSAAAGMAERMGTTEGESDRPLDPLTTQFSSPDFAAALIEVAQEI